MKSFFFLIFSILLSFSFANAQGISAAEQIIFSLSDENPAPGQTVVVSVQSYVADLNSANISWTVNGAAFQKGVGLTSIQVQAPTLGKQTRIGLTAATSDGRQLSGSYIIGSGSVDLILEADGYVPPFFEGKMPLTFQNSYRVIAIPHLANSAGKEYDPATLVYEWIKDSSNVAEQSGYGKQVFSWKDEVVPRQRSIQVKVSTRDGTSQAEKTLRIQANSPSIVFYKDDPLYGPMYNNALDSYMALGNSGEISVLAIPFGFNKPSGGVGNLTFTWLVNSVKQVALNASQSITLRAPGDAAGSSDISLDIKNSADILQGAKSGFTVTFNKSQTSSDLNSPNYNGI